MIKETYERLHMDVTQFDKEDIITTSEVAPVSHLHSFTTGRFEQGLNIPINM